MLDNQHEDKARLELAARVNEAIKSLERGGKRRVAEKCGITEQAITGWIKTGRIDKENLSIVADMSDYDLKWLITGSGDKFKSMHTVSAPSQPTDSNAKPSHALPRVQIIEWESPEDLPDGEYVIVPRFRLKLSAGNGNYITEELPDAPLAFTTEWIKKKGVRRSELCIVNATGDSMEPSICDGALLLVDTHSKQVTDGKVYALRYGDELRVKRLYRRYDGGLIIRSDNQAKYPDEALAPSDMNDHIYVIGRVIWQAADL